MPSHEVMDSFPNHVSINAFSKMTGLSRRAIDNRIAKGWIKIERVNVSVEMMLIPKSEVERVRKQLAKEGKMKPGRSKTI